MNRFDELPRPVGFVLAGGATLGAIQVGMLRALAEQGIHPDLVVGCSVGALNGAIVATTGDSGRAADHLERIWSSITTEDVFPGNRLQQGLRVLRGRSIYPQDGLRRLVSRSLGRVQEFSDLAVPLGVVASNVLEGRVTVFRSGPLEDPLVASAALPGVFPVIEMDGVPYWDGGVTSLVPVRAALRMGAASIVVLDPGDITHREIAPRGLPASFIAAFGTAVRQRVLVEARQVAQKVPMIYLDRPRVAGRDPLSFGSTERFIAQGHEVASRFLADAPLPTPGSMSGVPHTREDDLAGYEPRFLDR